MRGELERVLYSEIEGDEPIRFGSTVKWLDHEGSAINVEFSSGDVESFDLVIGADGVHSKIREIAFGEESRFSRFLGYYSAAFIIEHPTRSLRPGQAFNILTVPGKQLEIYPIRDDRVATFFVYKADSRVDDFSNETARRELRRVYENLGWIVPEILEASSDSDIYFDEVSQIQMPARSSDRIALVGDACQCGSLIVGQGASLAMAGAYILSQELTCEDQNVQSALRAYQNRMMAGVKKKQKAGQRIANWFVPDNEVSACNSEHVHATGRGPLGRLFFKRFFAAESIL